MSEAESKLKPEADSEYNIDPSIIMDKPSAEPFSTIIETNTNLHAEYVAACDTAKLLQGYDYDNKQCSEVNYDQNRSYYAIKLLDIIQERVLIGELALVSTWALSKGGRKSPEEQVFGWQLTSNLNADHTGHMIEFVGIDYMNQLLELAGSDHGLFRLRSESSFVRFFDVWVIKKSYLNLGSGVEVSDSESNTD